MFFSFFLFFFKEVVKQSVPYCFTELGITLLKLCLKMFQIWSNHSRQARICCGIHREILVLWVRGETSQVYEVSLHLHSSMIFHIKLPIVNQWGLHKWQYVLLRHSLKICMEQEETGEIRRNLSPDQTSQKCWQFATRSPLRDCKSLMIKYKLSWLWKAVMLEVFLNNIKFCRGTIIYVLHVFNYLYCHRRLLMADPLHYSTFVSHGVLISSFVSVRGVTLPYSHLIGPFRTVCYCY